MRPPRSAVEVSVESVKPATAQEWLLKNTSNRRIRARVVEAYARDMAAGNWRMSGEAIKFAKNGQLLDGQHRLHAVMVANVVVDLLVVRGLDDVVQSVMDTGATRTAGDALKLLGENSYNTRLAAAARLAILFEAGEVVGNNIKVTNTEIIGFVDEHPDLRRAVELTGGSWSTSIEVPPSVLAYTVWRLLQVDADACIAFFSALAEKTNLPAGSPILALEKRLGNIRRAGLRVERGDYLSLIFRAWNYWGAHKSIDGDFPIRKNGGAVRIPNPLIPVGRS